MKPRVTVFRSPFSAIAFDRADRDSVLVALVDGALEAITAPVIDRILARSCMLVVVAGDAVSKLPLGAALAADFLALEADATLDPGSDGDAIAGLIRRTGPRARAVLLLRSFMTAAEAVESGLAEALVPAGVDSVHWLRSWVGTRDLRALQAGAALIRANGGDVLERHEFARLFASGIPQQGLNRFLTKQEFRADAEAEWEIR